MLSMIQKVILYRGLIAAIQITRVIEVEAVQPSLRSMAVCKSANTWAAIELYLCLSYVIAYQTNYKVY